MFGNGKGACVCGALKADAGHVHVMLQRPQSPALVADVEAWAHTNIVIKNEVTLCKPVTSAVKGSCA